LNTNQIQPFFFHLSFYSPASISLFSCLFSLFSILFFSCKVQSFLHPTIQSLLHAFLIIPYLSLDLSGFISLFLPAYLLYLNLNLPFLSGFCGVFSGE